jgi:chromosome segregation ATPase
VSGVASASGASGGAGSSGAGAAKKAAKVKEASAAQLLIKDEFIKHLEEDVKKLQQELQQQKSVEQYLRGQLSYAGKCERSEKSKLDKLQQEHESLQKNFNKLRAQRQKDKEARDELEKKLAEEKVRVVRSFSPGK